MKQFCWAIARLGLVILFCLRAVSMVWAQGNTGPSPLQWKAVLVAASADGGLENWDNARRAFAKQLLKIGLTKHDIAMLSAHPRYQGQTEIAGKVRSATSYNIRFAIEDFKLKRGNALIVYISSHGAKNAGITMGLSQTFMDINALREVLGAVPDDVPTVILISTCYSGQFIDGFNGQDNTLEAQGDLRLDNRIILTASRADRPSFGCGEGLEMPEWDDSLIVAIQDRTPATTWQELFNRIYNSIAIKEQAYNEADHSLPQAFFGAAVRDLVSPFSFGSN